MIGTSQVASLGGVDVPIFRGCEEQWAQRLAKARPYIKEAQARSLNPTPYFVEAWAYYDRALKLQEMNLGQRRRGPVGDRLMEEIPIYDTVRRRYAGFSNVLEQLWYGAEAPKLKANIKAGRPWAKFQGTEAEWLYLCLVHRVTGSGASFEHDHGWRNTIVPALAARPPAERASWLLRFNERPIFTSIGNQIPPFNKKTNVNCRNAGHEYLGLVAPLLVEMMYGWLDGLSRQPLMPNPSLPVGITTAVDKALEFQRKLGWKQFKFVLTAWVMDIAEYLPHLVDPWSNCYHGKNAEASLRACFRPSRQLGRQAFLDAGTRLFADLTGTYPMDVEDASPGCDLIRWLTNYVPKKGFQHVLDHGLYNSSSLTYPHGRQPT